MASIHTFMTVPCVSASDSVRLSLFVGHPRRCPIPSRFPSSRTLLAFSRRQNTTPAITSSKKKSIKSSKKKKQILPDAKEEENLDEDAIEALFNQLEEDLKNDDGSVDDNDELSEEDLAKLERELEEALGDDDELLRMFNTTTDDPESDNYAEEHLDDDDDDEEERPVELKNWQLRRLASALKVGRRKTSIKNLAAELCLDRSIVLDMLRDPPPNLLLISAALPDTPKQIISEPETTKQIISELETRPMETVPAETTTDIARPEEKGKTPIHVMQNKWSTQKRLKKVHVKTLEKVYTRTKRPTNAMVSSIVHVTNLPRKRIVEWFEGRRIEDGVPDRHLPYQRSTLETVSSS